MGVPVLAPEIVLLFKAKRTEEKDMLDFQNVWPNLPSQSQEWLKNILGRLYPGHDWIRF
jgi:hypothetical protein